jgi:hypothetical protein
VREKISMTMVRLKHTHLALMFGISLFIPLFLAYSLYVDLSEIVLLSSQGLMVRQTKEIREVENIRGVIQLKNRDFGQRLFGQDLWV